MDTKRAAQMQTPEVRMLAEALVAIDTPELAQAFLVDLCTTREVEDLSQRLTVARMLLAGEPYAKVQKATGASSTTVSRVSRFLNGDNNGYRRILDKLGFAGE